MKRLLISTACAIFICGTACAREGTLSQTPTFQGSTIFATRHVAIDRRRQRDRRTLHDGIHFNPRRQRLVRSQVRGLRRLSEAR